MQKLIVLFFRRNIIYNFSLLDSELSSYLTLHPPIAKRALYCICALHPDKKDELLEKMNDVNESFLLISFVNKRLFRIHNMINLIMINLLHV